MIDSNKFFDQPIINYIWTYENIQIIAAGQGHNYKSGCLLYYAYFKDSYKLLPINLNKRQPPNDDPKVIQQISFT